MTAGGTVYTLGVKSIESDEALTLTVRYSGPSVDALNWTPVPYGTLAAITAELAAQVTYAFRGLNLDKKNWQRIFSADPEVTVHLPDLSTFTGPGWGYLISQMVKRDGSVMMSGCLNAPGIDLSSDTPFVDFHYKKDSADYNVRLINEQSGQFSFRSMTGWAQLNTGDQFINGTINFNRTDLARQSLLNMGVSGAFNRVLIPVSTTQAFMMLSVSHVGTNNASGDTTITFPQAFTTIYNVTVCNGDANVFVGSCNILNSIRTSGFDCRSYSSYNTPINGAIRINYIAIGLVDI